MPTTVQPYPVEMTWYNENGKYKYDAIVMVDVYAFDDNFKQQLVDRQSAIYDGWQNDDDYFVVVRNAEGHPDNRDDAPFVNSLYQKGAFANIRKGGTPPASTYQKL